MPAKNVKTRDEHGFDNEETEHHVLDDERIRDERTANIPGARMKVFGRGQIRESEELPIVSLRFLVNSVQASNFSDPLLTSRHYAPIAANTL